MSRQVAELETLLGQLITEHRQLLSALEAYQKAMKTFDARAMDESGAMQQACTKRITSLESRRRALVLQIKNQMRIEGELTMAKLAAMHPSRSAVLLKLRDDLKAVATLAVNRSYIAGRVAGAVLGHLNTAVRLLATAVGKAGVYTRDGIPRMTSRIGAIEAVG
jgi:hypothetical protein